MEITVDISDNQLEQLKALVDESNDEVAILMAVYYTLDNY